MKHLNFPLIILSAILCGLCYAIYKVGFIAYFAVIPYIYIVMKEADAGGKIRRFYGYGYVWALFYFITVFHWFVYQYPLEYLGFSKGLAILYIIVACVGTSAVLSLPTALFPLAYAACARTKLHKRLPFLSPFFIAAAYTICEWLLTKSDIAVPWARLALTQQSYIKFLQTSSMFGSYFISFIVMLFNTLLAYGLYKYKQSGKLKPLGVCAAICAGVFVCNYAVGCALYAVDEKNEEGTVVSASALQGNQISGRSEDLTLWETVDLYLTLAEDEINENGAQLIVMPEGCFGVDMVNDYPLVVQELSEFASEHGVTLVVGCFEDVDGLTYNVTYCFTPDGELSEPYTKHHLVPFGEFMPARSVLIHILPFMDGITMLESDLTPGKEIALFDTEYGKLGSLICYDSIFELLAAQETRDGAELLCVSTNDSWFMDSAAIYEHNGQSVLRAIENRRYVVRAANSGMSTVINARGEILDSLAPLLQGSVNADVVMRDDITFYSRCPNLFIILCAVFMVCCYGVGITLSVKARRQKEKQRNE